MHYFVKYFNILKIKVCTYLSESDSSLSEVESEFALNGLCHFPYLELKIKLVELVESSVTSTLTFSIFLPAIFTQ